jgi:hypothetical protein
MAGLTAHRTYQSIQASRVMPLWALYHRTWFTASTEPTEKKNDIWLCMICSPNSRFIHLQFQFQTVPKSLGLDESSLPTPLMLLHLLSITVVSIFHRAIATTIKMNCTMFAGRWCKGLLTTLKADCRLLNSTGHSPFSSYSENSPSEQSMSKGVPCTLKRKRWQPVSTRGTTTTELLEQCCKRGGRGPTNHQSIKL